jgi:hypothetical protein
MYSILPKTKLIYVLRDPIDRIVSHYTHNYAKNTENRTLHEALKNLENNHYVQCSKYYMQVEQYLSYYARDSILFITAEDLNKHRPSTLQKIFRFLEIDDNFYCQEYSRMLNKSAEKKRRSWIGVLLSKIPVSDKIKMSLPETITSLSKSMLGAKLERPILTSELRRDLVKALQDDVECLRNYTGLEFKSWCL